ncbi:MAG: hypothetical protein E7233_04070 [Lachnospiraceae bacterium]|nr:hypothetical protein [Lachnospiraceae bacterium]
MTRTARIISCIIKIAVIASAIAGSVLSAFAGRYVFMSGTRIFMYFTIQSNIALAIICAVGFVLLILNRPISKVWYVIKFAGTVSITLTGVVFAVMLAPTLGAKAWNIQNVLTHVCVPLLSVIDFFLTCSGTGLKKKNVFYVLIPPLMYAIYAGIGYVCGWEFSPGTNYPYFFLNWGSPAGAFGFTDRLPFLGCAWWILILCIFLILVGLGYLALADLIGRKRRRE